MTGPKQVVAVRRDLGMRKGKACAQAAHASMAWLTSRLDEADRIDAHVRVVGWLTDVQAAWVQGSFAKVVCSVSSEEELLELHARALAAGLESNLIRDEGRTEFGGVPTYTAVGIGPDTAERLDPVTRDLPLW